MNGICGEYGDAYVPETLAGRLDYIANKWDEIRESQEYIDELKFLLSHYGLRPTKLTEARNTNLSNEGECAKILLKREDQTHTAYGNLVTSLGMALFAKMIGETHILSETLAGSNGVAVASACATLGLKCTVMNADIEANKSNSLRKSNMYAMRLLGAKIVTTENHNSELLTTTSETLNMWYENIDKYFYIPYSPASPQPYSRIFHDILKIIGNEAREQILEEYNKLPDVIVSPLSQGSHIISLYSSFCDKPDLEFVAVEPKSEAGLPEDQAFDGVLEHTKVGVTCGLKTRYLHNQHNTITSYKTKIENLVYPVIAPEVAHLYDQKKIITTSVTYTQALEACLSLARNEGIISSVFTGYSLAYAFERAKEMHKSKTILLSVNAPTENDRIALSKYIKGRL